MDVTVEGGAGPRRVSLRPRVHSLLVHGNVRTRIIDGNDNCRLIIRKRSDPLLACGVARGRVLTLAS